jgi:hypothetical protein
VPVLLPGLPLQVPLLLVLLFATVLVPSLLHRLLIECAHLLRWPLLWMPLQLLPVLLLRQLLLLLRTRVLLQNRRVL